MRKKAAPPFSESKLQAHRIHSSMSQTGANFKRIESICRCRRPNEEKGGAALFRYHFLDVVDQIKLQVNRIHSSMSQTESIRRCRRLEQTSSASNPFVDVADWSKLQVHRIHSSMSQTESHRIHSSMSQTKLQVHRIHSSMS